jgi:hypothetical protein
MTGANFMTSGLVPTANSTRQRRTDLRARTEPRDTGIPPRNRRSHYRLNAGACPRRLPDPNWRAFGCGTRDLASPTLEPCFRREY